MDKTKLRTISGGALEWGVIEFFLCVTFVFSMVALVCKSRFVKVGIDNSQQFEPKYMCYLIDDLLKEVAKKPEKFTDSKWIDKQRGIEYEGIEVKIKFTESDFFKVKAAIDAGQTEGFVNEEDATPWVTRNIVGQITKEDLDKQRCSELNAFDMTQNTSIIYHYESIIEMQLLCSAILYYLQNKDHHDNILDSFTSDKFSTNFIMYLLFVEHLISYGCAYYRYADIAKNGKMDLNGVIRAKKELSLQNFQLFVTCIIIGYTVKHLLEMSTTDQLSQSYQLYWIIIDCIIMISTSFYIGISLDMKRAGEVTKNIFTLYFLQS